MDKNVNNTVDALSKTTQLVIDDGFLAVSGGVIILMAIIFLVIVIILFRSMIRRSDESSKDNKQFMNSLIDNFKDNMKQDREDRITIFNDISKHISITNEKMEILMEGINNSFQGVYSIIGETCDKINDEKELSEEEFLKQASIIMENSIYMIKDIMLIKVEKNSLKEQRINNIGNDGTGKDGEIYDSVMRIVNEGRARITQLKFYNTNIKRNLFNKSDEIILESVSQLCKIFNIHEENYKKNEINTQIRLIASRSLTIIKGIKIEDIKK